MRDQAYMDWLKSRKCSVLGCFPAMPWPYGMFVDPAHTQNNGMGSKGPDSSCAPLCRMHHREYDAGRAAFEKRYKVDMRREAEAHHALFKMLEASEE